MAKQMNETIFTGRIGGLVFYEMEGKGYVRRKSGLTRKQFFTQSCFAGSRNSAERFALANRIAGAFYRQLPVHERDYGLFCKLKRTAILLLKEGETADAVYAQLQQVVSFLP